MKKTILIIMLLLLAVSASAEINHYYKINLHYQEGNLSSRAIIVEPSSEKLQAPKGTYVAEVISENEILNFTFFAIPLTIFYDYVDPETGEIIDGGMKELNETEAIIYVPYYDNAQEINIYDRDLIKKLTIDISSYAKETAAPEEKELEEITIKEKRTGMVKPETTTIKWVLFGTGAVILLILIIIFLRKRKQ